MGLFRNPKPQILNPALNPKPFEPCLKPQTPNKPHTLKLGGRLVDGRPNPKSETLKPIPLADVRRTLGREGVEERGPLRQKSRVERLKAKVDPLST